MTILRGTIVVAPREDATDADGDDVDAMTARFLVVICRVDSMVAAVRLVELAAGPVTGMPVPGGVGLVEVTGPGPGALIWADDMRGVAVSSGGATVNAVEKGIWSEIGVAGAT